MPGNLNVVEFTHSWLEPCSNLYAGVFNSPPWSEAWIVDVVISRLSEILGTPGSYGLVVIDGQAPVALILGYCETFVDGVDFYIKEMCVKSDRQREGIGAMVLGALREELHSEGVRKLYLLSARGSAAEDFYRKMGFYVSEKMIMMGLWLPPNVDHEHLT